MALFAFEAVRQSGGVNIRAGGGCHRGRSGVERVREQGLILL